MLTIHTAYKHETSYKVHSVIKQCFTNGTVHLQCSAVKISIIYVVLSHVNLILKLTVLVQKYV